MARPIENMERGSQDVRDAEWPLHVAARRGYLDAVRGQGFGRDYEELSTDEQLAYESTRLWVSNMRLAQIKPPTWPKDGPPPWRVSTEAARAQRLRGASLPTDMLPPTEDRVTLEPEPVTFRRRRSFRRIREHAR